jgi:hypothetical protein
MFCFWNQITQHVKIKGQISGRTHPLRFMPTNIYIFFYFFLLFKYIFVRFKKSRFKIVNIPVPRTHSPRGSKGQ